MLKSTLLSLALTCMTLPALGGEEPVPVPEAEQKVREGILAFRKDMASEDEAVRTAAFDRVLPDKALMERLLNKAAEPLWSKMEEELKTMRQRTADLRRELDRHGTPKAVKLADVRKKDDAGRFGEVLAMIPKDIPIYTAVIEHEKGSSGSSTYLLVDGTMRWVPGLEELCARARRETEKGARREAAFPELSKLFLAALRSEKIEDAMACWVSVKEMEEFAKNPPAELPAEAKGELAEMPDYLRKRNAVIAVWFPDLVKVLKARGLEPKDLEYEGSEGRTKVQQGIETASSVTMKFKHEGGSIVQVRIDDGFKLNGRWRFMDKPLDVAVDGKHVEINKKTGAEEEE